MQPYCPDIATCTISTAMIHRHAIYKIISNKCHKLNVSRFLQRHGIIIYCSWFRFKTRKVSLATLSSFQSPLVALLSSACLESRVDWVSCQASRAQRQERIVSRLLAPNGLFRGPARTILHGQYTSEGAWRAPLGAECNLLWLPVTAYDHAHA